MSLSGRITTLEAQAGAIRAERLIQGFTRAQLERALSDAGAAGDHVGAAALKIALGDDMDGLAVRMMDWDAEDVVRATKAATDLRSWVTP